MSERTITLRLGRAPGEMRYRTVGDWRETPDGFEIVVADCGDARYEALVGLHELVEVLLCKQHGVTAEMVDAFDFSRQEDDDPGLNPEAPYHREHMVAFSVECLLAAAYGVDWVTYNRALDDAWERVPERE